MTRTPHPNDDGGRRPASALATLGGRVSRDASVYGAAGIIALTLGLASLAVLTRFLEPAEFGDFALLSFFSTVLMTLYNLGSIQGITGLVYGGAGDGEDDDVGAQDSRAAPVDRRRALGSGVVLTALVGLVGTLAILPIAPMLADLLMHEDRPASLVYWAAGAAAFAALWRLSTQVLRVERRPYAYLAVYSVHPILTVGAIVPLVATGGGVEGAIAGLAIGNAASAVVAMAAIRRSVRLGFRRRHAVVIFRLGSIRVPLAISFWLIQNADIFIVSRFLPAHDVGLYRVASRVGAMTNYWTSSFLMAWGPLHREPVHLAAERELTRQRIRGIMVTYFTLLTVAFILVLALFAHILVQIAPPAYADAAPLIPLLGLSFAAHGWYILSYRIAMFPHARLWFTLLAAATLLMFIPLALAATPLLGLYGPPLAVVAAFAISTVVMVVRNQLGENPIPLEWGRMGLGVALAGACFAAVEAGSGIAGVPDTVLALLGMAAFPALLLATRVLTRSQVEALIRVLRVTPQRMPRRSLRSRVAELSDVERAVLELVVRHRRRPTELAALAGVEERDILSRVVAALRRVAAAGEPTETDADIARYLLWSEAIANRDAASADLWAAGADPSDVHQLSIAIGSLRRGGRSTWRDQPGRDPVPGPAERQAIRPDSTASSPS